MIDADAKTDENPGRIVLLSLVLSRFATVPPNVLTGLLLIDIGNTFGQAVGVTGQIRTAANLVGVASALLISALSLRFKPKSLLIWGLALLVASTAGCALAPSFPVLLAVYALTGMAGAFVGPMALTLVAEHFPSEQRANAVSWIIAGMSAAHLVGAPIIGYISGFVGWRGSFLWFVLPVALIGLFLAVRFVPSGQQSTQGDRGSGTGITEGFRAVFTDTSAVACLIGSALLVAAYMAMVTYSPSLYRERFGLSTAHTSLIVIGFSVFFISGTRICGRLVTRFGRKPILLWPAALASLFIFAYANLPNLWLSVAARFLGSTFSAIVFTAANALTLEQVPRFRGTVMSLSQATFSLGGVLGTGLGGLVILLYGYGAMGLSHGAMMLAAMLVLYFFAKEPQN
jgi:DHA1 family inner membrane transport protein